jgi:hypothetical protein
MLDRAHLFASTALALAFVFSGAACSKTDAPSEDTAPTATASQSATPTVKAAAPEAAAPAADTVTPTTTTAASADAGSAAQCGTKPLPDCPLQAWMKANTNPAVASSDFAGLATALDKVATFAPAGYTNWASISKDGAKAARAQDMSAVKASCRGCHDQYKSKYKTELRTKKI